MTKYNLLPESLLLNLLASSVVSAQIVPDQTLPRLSIVKSQNNTFEITGGTRRGNNLFHSFKEFSVPLGTTAFFNNILRIQNIFTRVTGSSISNIDGLIKANGTANLFLINPNGIVFGSNASLNIGGSFMASTANRVIFSDGFEYKTTSETDPLLTINVPVGLGFGVSTGEIINQSRYQITEPVIGRTEKAGEFNIDPYVAGLQVNEGKSIALVGGNIVFAGGNLTTNGGRIEIGSVADNSIVNLSETEIGWILNYEKVTDFLDITLTAPTIIDSSGEMGGSIQLQGKNILFTSNLFLNLFNINVLIYSNTLGTGKGETITVKASESIETRENIGGIATFSETTGIAGDILVDTQTLINTNGELIKFTGNSINGSQSGNLMVNFSEYILNTSEDLTLVAIVESGGFLFPDLLTTPVASENPSFLPPTGMAMEEPTQVIQEVATETVVVAEEPVYTLDETVISALVDKKVRNNLDAENLVNHSFCEIEKGQIAAGGSFKITGRGGLPPSPSDPAIPNAMVDWATRSPQVEKPPVILKERSHNHPPTIQPIQGWRKEADGTIVLTADASTVAPESPILVHPGCR